MSNVEISGRRFNVNRALIIPRETCAEIVPETGRPRAVPAGDVSWDLIMKSCLIVDDSDVIRRVARRILESLGFQIQEAENGQEALKQCGEAMPDSILLDWHMPGMGAMELLRALRRAPKGNKAYIIYCTSENNRHDISRALAAGADDYLIKPFERQSLSEKFIKI